MSRRIPIPSRVASPSDQLAALIRGCGMTPAALGAAAGVAPSVLSRFLRGERSLALETVDRLAVALGGVRLEVARSKGRMASRKGDARACDRESSSLPDGATSSGDFEPHKTHNPGVAMPGRDRDLSRPIPPGDDAKDDGPDGVELSFFSGALP